MKSKILFFISLYIFVSGCTMVNHSIPTSMIYLSDLNISDEVWGQAKSTKILGIDFQRLLKRNIESANVGLSTTSIPSITAIKGITDVFLFSSSNSSPNLFANLLSPCQIAKR